MKKLLLSIILLSFCSILFAGEVNTYAIVNKDGEVLNTVLWDGEKKFEPCKDCELVKLWETDYEYIDEEGNKKTYKALVRVDKGDTYKDGKFNAHNP